MAIEVRVVLASTARQRPDVSAVVDLNGTLGSTRASGQVRMIVDPYATATGARIALSGDVSFVADPGATPKRYIIADVDDTSPYNHNATQRPFIWYCSPYSYYMEYYEVIIHPTDLVVDDIYDEAAQLMEMDVSSTLTVVSTVGAELPSPPAPPPAQEPSGDFPMPASGGIVIRAVPGIAVQMDDPVIVDGRPT